MTHKILAFTLAEWAIAAPAMYYFGMWVVLPLFAMNLLGYYEKSTKGSDNGNS